MTAPRDPAAGVVAAIDAVALADPARVAVVDHARAVDYAALVRASRCVAAWLLRQGVAPGDTIGLTLREEYPHLLATLALLALGCRQVALGSREPAEMRADLAARLRVVAVLADRAEDAVPGVAMLLPDLRAIAAASSRDDAAPLPGGGSLVIASSGTTGRPKLLELPEAALARQGAMTAYLGTVRYRTIGNEFAVAKRLQLHTLSAGGTEVLANNGAGRGIAEVCAAFGVTRFNATPLRAEALLAEMARPGAPAWPVATGITLAGGPVPSALRRRLMEALTPDVCVLYGTSETGPISIAGPEDHALHPDTVGRPLPGVAIEVVDEAGRALPAGESGLVRVRSVAAATGYLDDAAASARALQDGWFLPGDAGWLSPEGALVLSGRADDMMNLGTIKIFPAEIEAAAAGFPGVADCAAFAQRSAAMGDVPLLAVVAADGFDAGALLAQCRARLGLRAPRGVVVVPALPRNPQGKILRRELAAMSRPADG
jgi:acyl-CoA synthetase (AMP-forming)/AMP-acid ligase II